MRILHVVGKLDRGGAETWLLQVLRHVDRDKYHMDFLVHGMEAGAYDEEVKALGGRVIACLAPSNPLRYAFNFRRILREYGPYDCVHSHIHHYSGYVLLLAAALRVPMRIVHSHNDTRAVDQGASWLRKAYLSGMANLIHWFATAGIAVSESAAQSLFLKSWKSDPRWSLCPLGIDLRPFNELVDSQQVRTELGIHSDAFVVGHVGRFVEQKHHCFLVEVAERLCRREPKAIFLLVGDGPLKPEIERMVRARDLARHFIFTGVRSDVPRLMKGAMDCFLFPSRYEGLGLVLWEAQASGLPCLISEGVPQEADAIPDLVTRLSLDTHAQEWASSLAEMTDASTHPKRSSFAPHPAIKALSIEASMQRLVTVYESAAT